MSGQFTDTVARRIQWRYAIHRCSASYNAVATQPQSVLRLNTLATLTMNTAVTWSCRLV